MNQVANVLPNGPVIAEVMVLGQIPLELMIVRELRADDMDLQRSERGQVVDHGLGLKGIKQFRIQRGASHHRRPPPLR